jgi:hypothetical protein
MGHGEHAAKAHGEGAGVLAYEQTPKLAEALTAVQTAERAVKADERDAALKALANAEELIAASHKALAAHMPPLVNARCPVSGEPVDPASLSPERTRLHEGKRVGFCCPACPARWDEMSDEQKREALEKAGAATEPADADAGVVNTRCPMMGTEIDPENVPENLTRPYKGKTIGFCCGGCPQAWDRLSDEQKTAKLSNLLSEVD